MSGIQVEVVRKRIKNLYVRIYPPEGRVRATVPVGLSDEEIRSAIVSRSEWILRHREKLSKEPQPGYTMDTGEIHHFQGRGYRLQVIEHLGPPSVRIVDNTTLQLIVRPGTGRGKREAVLQQWYRQMLRKRIRELIPQWQPVIGVEVADWGIKKMKTLWGSCNTRARRVWVNLELAKKPPECLEYILVHEMLHLLERHHNERFRELMNKLMPQWRLHRDKLNQTPLSHEDWSY